MEHTKPMIVPAISSASLVFFGNERLVSGLKQTEAPILRGLLANGYHIACIVANYTDGTSRSNRPLEVAAIAEEYNIPLLLPKKVSDIAADLKSFGAEAAVLVAYGQIIPQAIIDFFPKGIINVHPSLLPKYRGPTPIESVIANGDARTGVSIMALSARMDAGAVYAQESVTLTGRETKFELYDTLNTIACQLLLRVLPHILDGSLTPQPQNDEAATYCQLFTKKDSWLQPATMSAVTAERLVRAHLGFPKSKLTIHGHECIITQAHVGTAAESPLDVRFADDSSLSIDQLIAPSGKTMTGESFLRGYADKS